MYISENLYTKQSNTSIESYSVNGSAGVNALTKSEHKQRGPSASNGDTAIFSKPAKILAGLDLSDSPFGKLNFSVQASLTDRNGARIEVAIAEAGENAEFAGAVRVTVVHPDNTAQIFFMDQSSALKMNADGSYSAELIGDSFKGTDADEMVFIIPDQDGNTPKIDAGNGNNRVYSYFAVKNADISSGDGHDFIHVAKADNLKINSGTGDDSLYIGESSAADIDTGDGHDHIKANKLSGNVSTGNGNDHVLLGNYVEGIIKNRDISGAGTNPIENLSLDTGDGDDMVTIGTAIASTISGGAGNDTISVGNAVGSIISGGDGDDSITVHFSSLTAMDGGAGNDSIHLVSADDALISGGDGDDQIIADTLESSSVSADAGNDTIYVGTAEKTLIEAGDGDDLILAEKITDSYVDGGNGSDSIRISAVHASTVAGGKGSDSIAIENSADSKILGDDQEDAVEETDNENPQGEKEPAKQDELLNPFVLLKESEISKSDQVEDEYAKTFAESSKEIPQERVLSDYEKSIADGAIGIVAENTVKSPQKKSGEDAANRLFDETMPAGEKTNQSKKQGRNAGIAAYQAAVGNMARYSRNI